MRFFLSLFPFFTISCLALKVYECLFRLLRTCTRTIWVTIPLPHSLKLYQSAPHIPQQDKSLFFSAKIVSIGWKLFGGKRDQEQKQTKWWATKQQQTWF